MPKIINHTEDIPSEFKGRWCAMSIQLTLSKNFIREFKDKVDWSSISQFQVLSEDFIREFEDSVRWSNISQYQVLTENFIREFKYKVSWSSISKHQKLSEKFIRDHIDNVNWCNITAYQTLSDEFVKEFSRYLRDYNLLKSVHYCGKRNRVIYINKEQPNIIHIGCSRYTKDGAIAAISEEYTGEEKEEYINKVLECFDYKK